MTFKNTEKISHFQPFGALDSLKNHPAKNHLTEHNTADIVYLYFNNKRGRKKQKGKKEDRERQKEREKVAKNEN